MKTPDNPTIRNLNVEALVAMAHDPIDNYVIPGLTSWKIGGEGGTKACVRMFECARDHQETVAPHSHRYDLYSVVLSGWVENYIWVPSDNGDPYMQREQDYQGRPGKYETHLGVVGNWDYSRESYGPGDTYFMEADTVHSIKFGKGARVLVFQGAQVSGTSVVLEPVVGGLVIPTSAVAPWMFKVRDTSGATLSASTIPALKIEPSP